jgi:hypothetical protein
MPFNEADPRIEPLVSDPKLMGTIPPATAAADPTDEPHEELPPMRVPRLGNLLTCNSFATG